ncbi:unnamed protein product [Caenorhabditis auriculariae]|uniref:Exportin-2 n=1 Tax=Caenorhabditis auriculariae TaxID=2777116 RepID=A0A8S1HCQ5_9PELO|nr:unnamed protein product [Caenorhabditis auriculariae]
MSNLVEILSRTLEPDNSVRKAAEDQLRQMELVPGFARNLLELINKPDLAGQLRFSAAVKLKNFIKRNWGEAADVEISSEDQISIRQELLETIFRVPEYLSVLSNALQLIAQADFPAKWPELITYLAKPLESENLDHIMCSLSTMKQIFRKFRYESKSTELWTELKHCLINVQEPLTSILGKMMGFLETRDQMDARSRSRWIEVLYCICAVYHSLCSQDIPEYFEDNLKPWMESLLALMGIELNEGSSDDLIKLKTEICEVFTLYAQRYEEEIAPFIPGIIGAVWALIERTGQDTRYDEMVCAAMEFLSIICQRNYHAAHFEGQGVVQAIAENVCVKNLHLREEDIEQFEDEPLEYIKRDLEGTDIGTRRRGAIDLIRALCRRYEAQIMPSLSQIVQTLIVDGNWRKIDVVYSLVTAMAAKSETARSGATEVTALINVVDFYNSQVRNHLSSSANNTPILQADALRFCVTFRNMLPPSTLVEVINAADALLQSNFQIVRDYSAYAVERLLVMQNTETKRPLFTTEVVPVRSLLGNLVGAYDKAAAPGFCSYLIKALLRVITLADDETMRHASALADKLVQLVALATKQAVDAVHTHFLFETLCVLIVKTRSAGSNIDSQLLPLIEVVFAQDVEDLIPYALQITGVLLSSCVSRGESINSYHQFLPLLLSEKLWARSTNVPAAITVLEVFLNAASDFVLSQQSQIVFQHYSRLVSSKALDQHGFQLANALLPHINKCVGVENPMAFLFNTMFRRVQNSKTPKFMKQFVVFLFRFSITLSSEELIRSVESIQPGMFNMIMEKVVLVELENCEKMFTFQDKRIIAIGAANIMSEATQYVTASYGKLAKLVAALFEGSTAGERTVLSPEEEQAAMYNSEGEFVNPYCRLSYAPRPEPVAPQITNFRAYFAQAVLERGPLNNGAVSSCIPQDLAQYLKSIPA